MDFEEINEVKEVNSIEEAQKLLDEHWRIIEHGSDILHTESKLSDTIPMLDKKTTFRFILGRVKPIEYPNLRAEYEEALAKGYGK